MSTNTSNYSLVKLALTDSPPDITAINPNWDKIDVEMKKNADSAKVAQTYETAGGTGTAITIATLDFVNGISRTFVASANNGGAATTLNGKPLYKPGTTTAPNITTGKAYTVWYNLAGNCFFLKASAEGNAVAANVLAGTTFSNDGDTGIAGEMINNGPASAETVNLTSNNQEYTIATGYHSGLRKIKAVITNLAAGVIKAGTTVGGILGTFTSDATAAAGNLLIGITAYVNGNKITGTMPDNGAVSQSLAINGSYTIPAGYHDGNGVVSQSVTIKGAATITPSIANQTIAANQYLTGIQTILGDADLVTGNIKAGANIFGVAGSPNVVDTTPGTAIAADILTSKVAFVDGAQITGSMPNNAAPTTTLTTQGSSKVVPAGYSPGGVITASFTNLSAPNVKSGVNVGGVVGTLEPAPALSHTNITAVSVARDPNDKEIGLMVTKPASIYMAPGSSYTRADFLFVQYFTGSGQSTDRFTISVASGIIYVMTRFTSTTRVTVTPSTPHITDTTNFAILNPGRVTVTVTYSTGTYNKSVYPGTLIS